MMQLQNFFIRVLSDYKQNSVLKFTSISTMSVILLILGIFLFLTFNLDKVIGIIEKKVEITVFLKDTVTEENLTELLQNVKNINGIEKINYISKNDALSEFIKDPEMKKFIDASGENPLPSSLRIKVKKEIYEKGGLPEIVELLICLDGVEDVKYKKEETEKLLKLIYTVKTGLAATGVIFLFVSFIVILNTAKLALLSRSSEITLIKSGGVSLWTIRLPFIIEGIIDGSIAGSIASFIIYLFSFLALNSLKTIWGDLGISFSIELFIIIISLSITIAVISNLLSIQKFLK